ncbi:Choline/Carnitine o-acyltransferase-domain-containing protein [Chlamydoabsidia padenii]|nr:Choline/Carnitine o-acyltransferase-domain-containing protein [Chlamydoabsidia padenii]
MTKLIGMDDIENQGQTFKYQVQLPKLPVPDLKATTDRYLSALKPLQSPQDHRRTKEAVRFFLENDGPELQKKLLSYATTQSSYIEEFWYDAYLQHSNSVVLNLNPFFLLEDDPTPQRNDQIIRASSLIASTVTFINALRRQELEPDVFRGTPLCMSQFNRLFATTRVPTEEHGCFMSTDDASQHVVVMAHSQCYHFDVFDSLGNVAVTEKEISANLRAIVRDASQVPVQDIAKNAVGVLTTENRQNWARLRTSMMQQNGDALRVVDSALFVVCLDHIEPTTIEDLSTNMLCGTYKLEKGLQVGTCTNRWYDKLQIIVCKNGSAGINFEHTGVDGHTVLRFVSDIYTDTILRFAKTINSQTKSIFHSYKTNKSPPRGSPAAMMATRNRSGSDTSTTFDINPRRIEWHMTEELTQGIKFAETRLSDLILQNEVKVLEFTNYGKYFITDMKMSPDAFVQMAFQAAYYGLYGKLECTYEPAMTKSFLHGRTESIRSVTDLSLDFVKAYYNKDNTPQMKLDALRSALKQHTVLTRDCAQGQGQDRHLYALECLFDRLNKNGENKPSLFTDPGWQLLNHTVLSTSNCGNPALRLFGFGPVVSDGFGIGYIIKEDGISFVASSKHRQTERLLATLKQYLIDIQQMMMDEKYPGGMSQKQRLLAMEEAHALVNGYSYFDNGEGDQYSVGSDDGGSSSSLNNNGNGTPHRKVDYSDTEDEVDASHDLGDIEMLVDFNTKSRKTAMAGVIDDITIGMGAVAINPSKKYKKYGPIKSTFSNNCATRWNTQLG